MYAREAVHARVRLVEGDKSVCAHPQRMKGTEVQSVSWGGSSQEE